MPRTKTYRSRSPGQKILDVIAYHQSRMELSHKELAIKIAIPYETLLRREKSPDKFTVGELTRMSAAFGVPLADLVSGNVGI